MGQLVFVTGLSGAGRTVAGTALQDLGWFVIDNLPVSLLPKVAELASGGGTYDKVALVMAAADEDLAKAIDLLRTERNDVRILFLEASTDVLVRRFESTKRRHPVQSPEGSLIDKIENERRRLQSARTLADLVIDTSSLSPHQLRARMAMQFSDATSGESLNLTISSFGFKHGVPLDVDMVVDCRFLPNPYWDEALRPLRRHRPRDPGLRLRRRAGAGVPRTPRFPARGTPPGLRRGGPGLSQRSPSAAPVVIIGRWPSPSTWQPFSSSADGSRE